jgi:hypothetical protein
LTAGALRVGRHVAQVGVGEGCHERDAPLLALVEHLLRDLGGETLVVTIHQLVGVVHGGGVHREPVEESHFLLIGADELEHGHEGVGVVLVFGAFRRWVESVGVGTAVDVGAHEVALRHEDVGRTHLGVSAVDAADDAAYHRIKGWSGGRIRDCFLG